MLPVRHVARLIIIDAVNSVLLCRYSEAGAAGSSTYWVPPGGALEPGEDHQEAALRELREETGLAEPLGRVLWERRFTLQLQGAPVDQRERYFLVQPSSERPPVRNASLEDIRELRWWSLDELRRTTERIYPDGLVEEYAALLAGAVRNDQAI